MMTFGDRRALRAARNVDTAELAVRLAQSLVAAGEEITRVASVSEVVEADYATDAVTPAQDAAWRDFAVLTAAAFDRFTAELAVLNGRLGRSL